VPACSHAGLPALTASWLPDHCQWQTIHWPRPVPQLLPDAPLTDCLPAFLRRERLRQRDMEYHSERKAARDRERQCQADMYDSDGEGELEPWQRQAYRCGLLQLQGQAVVCAAGSHCCASKLVQTCKPMDADRDGSGAAQLHKGCTSCRQGPEAGAWCRGTSGSSHAGAVGCCCMSSRMACTAPSQPLTPVMQPPVLHHTLTSMATPISAQC
jgi:hypothetical protein